MQLLFWDKCLQSRCVESLVGRIVTSKWGPTQLRDKSTLRRCLRGDTPWERLVLGFLSEVDKDYLLKQNRVPISTGHLGLGLKGNNQAEFEGANAAILALLSLAALVGRSSSIF